MTKLIFEMDDLELQQHVQQWVVPKFASLCYFKWRKIPCLDGLLIDRDTEYEVAKNLSAHFYDIKKIRNAMWRSDGRIERKHYRQGGISVSIDIMETAIKTLLEAHRDVIILEPLNRFKHLRAFSGVMTRQGDLTVECLGPGYDGSDLQRGHVTPELLLYANVSNGTLTPRDIRQKKVTLNTCQDRIQQRLLNLGQNIIPSMMWPRLYGESHAEYAKRFLLDHKYNFLFEKSNLELSQSDMRMVCKISENIFRDFLVTKKWDICSFNFVRSSKKDFVAWDLFNAANKYGR